MGFEPRLKLPEVNNPYYNLVDNGGYSKAIAGKPTVSGLNALSNCVGWAYGRFHEIAGDKKMSLLSPVNAENFIDYASKKLRTGSEPKLGACMVWQKGATKTGADGCGHVAIVEQINSDGSIVTSESGWNNSRIFWTTTRKKGNGNWGEGAGYKFLGFIYQPTEVIPSTNVEPKKPSKNTDTEPPYLVRVSIKNLNIRKGPGTNYGTTGKFTGIGVFTIVEEADGEGASKWGKLKSGAGWISLDYTQKKV